jgi:hypothetical protein
MVRRHLGPRRSGSVKSVLRRTRTLAAIATAALVLAIVSDATTTRFWGRHALLASLTASLIVIIVSIAAINEVLERQRRRRWSVLAQYVLFQLVHNVRLIWTGVLGLSGLLAPDASTNDALKAGAEIVRDRSRLLGAVRGLIASEPNRLLLHDAINRLADDSAETLGRWAGVMLNGEIYTEIIDRHVELAGMLSWISSLLDVSYPSPDKRRYWRARISLAVQVEGKLGAGDIADRIVRMTELAERLDRLTIEVALAIVPMEWWEARLEPET